MAWKIVDTFNGFEDDRLFDRLEDAEAIIDRMVSDFYRDNRGGAYPSYQAVPAAYDWYFDQRQNRFIWG